MVNCLNWAISKIKGLNAKKYFSILIATIFLTDLTILLDIPFIRQILSFLCFTTIPGLLILHILKLNKMGFLEKFVISVSLSIVFLIFNGLLINNLYPVISRPLSLPPIMASTNIILLMLTVAAYNRNKDNSDSTLENFFNFKLYAGDKLTSPIIFSALFPFMAVFGTHLMNTQGNNIILLATLFLIPAYIVALIILRNKISEITYPIAVWMIGMSLLLMYSLTSNYLMGRDIHVEFHVFQLSLKDFHWSINDYLHAYNTCLSVTILPTVYSVLTNLNDMYIFKLLLVLIWSVGTLGIYSISKKYLNSSENAFIASLFFIFQFPFIYSSGWVKQSIALLLFISSFLALFSENIAEISKRILFLVFMFSAVVSHYTVAFVFFVYLASSFILFRLIPLLLRKGNKSFLNEIKLDICTNVSSVLLFFVTFFFWYSQLTQIPFSDGIKFIGKTLQNLWNFFAEDVRNPAVKSLVGIGWKSMPNAISIIVHNLTFLTIIIGALKLLKEYISSKGKSDVMYLTMVLVSLSLLISTIIFPYLSWGYGSDRLFLQTLVFLAPVFVMGGKVIARVINKPKIDAAILMILLFLLFSCTTHLQYHFSGVPYSPIYESKGMFRDQEYIYEQDIAGAKWLNKYGLKNFTIFSDHFGYSRLMLAFEDMPNVYVKFFDDNSSMVRGYIYLRGANVINKVVYIRPLDYESKDIFQYSHLFTEKNKIYNNGGSEVWCD